MVAKRSTPEDANPTDTEAITVAVPPPGRRFRLPQPLSAFAYRDYRLLWIGTFTTQTGQWVQVVAIGWLMLELAPVDSGFYLGLAGFLRSVPQLFFSLPAGILADRVDRRRLLVVSQGTAAGLTLFLTILIASGQVQVWQVLLLTFLIGSAMAMVFPVRQTLVPSTVPKRDLASAVALNSTNNNVTRTLGPALAGVMIAAAGVPLCFLAQSIGLMVSFVTSIMLRVPPRVLTRVRTSPLGDLREAFAYIRRTPTVSGLLLAAAVPTALGMPYLSLLPLFARDLAIGATGLGLLMTVVGIGSIAGSVLLTGIGTGRRVGWIMLGSAAGFGISLLGLAASTSVTTAMVSLLFTGGLSAVYQAANNTLLQTTVPDALRGRVLSFYILTWGLMPLGTLPLGWLSDQISAAFAVGLSGTLVIVFSLILMVRVPALRKI